MRIVIYLRDRNTSPCRMIVEAQREVDFESLNHEVDLTDYDTEQGAFEDFVVQARSAMPIREQNVDVYIGWWGHQATFSIPQEFFRLITETRWPVSFDIND